MIYQKNMAPGINVVTLANNGVAYSTAVCAGHGTGAVRNEPPPNHAQHLTQAGRDSHEPNGTGGNVQPRGDGAITAEKRRWKWASFVFGNLISFGVVVSEINSSAVCFDDNIAGDDFTPEENANTVHFLTMTTLIFGLWVDFLSAVCLSAIYRSPLDIRSVHKIPPDDRRNVGGIIIVHFLAPFFWAVLFCCGGSASLLYANNSSCQGKRSAALEIYLLYSGLIMLLVAVLMLVLSALLAVFGCRSPLRRMETCWNTGRNKLYKTVLSKGPFLGAWWIIQGAVWAYRSGGLSLFPAIFVGLSGAIGESLVAFGSLAPEGVQ